MDASAPKHRACDECRTRKLACTKEANGCSRCKREGIACHYSPQKPMGRPRKRMVEDTNGNNVASKPEERALNHSNNDDHNMSMMDLDDPSMFTNPNDMTFEEDFLDFFGPDFISTESVDASFQKKPLGTDPLKINPLQYGLWDFNINFNMTFDDSPGAESEANQDVVVTSSSDLSQGASTRPPTPPLGPPSSCGCLAGLYLALDSISRLPKHVAPAMSVARGASRTAWYTINCEICSPPLSEDNMQVPISTFQSMMLLGALLPSIADAYKRILDMVEVESAKATAERRQLYFRLDEYGGLWGKMAGPDCGMDRLYENHEMTPQLWRLTMRALLKLDVYGINKAPHEGIYTSRNQPFTQVGLKDIVMQMDKRSLTRHAQIDDLVANHGFQYPRGPAGIWHHHEDREPACRRIIEIAKRSLDALVIP